MKNDMFWKHGFKKQNRILIFSVYFQVSDTVALSNRQETLTIHYIFQRAKLKISVT